MIQEAFFVEVLKALERNGVPYMIAGSVGAMAYGQPRLTNDIDIVADLRPHQVETLLQAFPQELYYVPSAEFVRAAVTRRGMFNIIHAASGSKADIIILKDDEFARSEFARRTRIPFTAGWEAFAAAPEDVIVAKLRYYQRGRSEKHPRDVAGMLRVSGSRLDRDYIAGWVSRLGLEEGWKEALRLVESSES